MEFLKDTDERQKRQALALIAQRHGTHGVSMVCGAFPVNRNTIYRGRRELASGEHLDGGRVRKEGGGRKRTLDKHPEYIDVFRKIVAYDIAGLPQNANTKWLRLKPVQIKRAFAEEYQIVISIYIIRLIIREEGYTYRKPMKDLPMAECENRNEQFENIERLRMEQVAKREPTISVDTKKKEEVGNFRRGDGRIYSKEPIRTFDHDFSTFGDGKIIPYGIYDVMKNTGYVTLGTSHDTAEFACDCIEEHWRNELRHVYPNAKSILILCDGGGSNSARGWLFKWSLIRLAKRIKVDIRVAHYPPYCSKWNPIEHRLFSQITKAWEGCIFTSIEEAWELASNTRTMTGLAVFASINRKNYETNKVRDPSFEEECRKHIVYDDYLSKWNYVIKWNP